MPSEGGVYLILSGVVQLIDRDTKTGRVTTTIVITTIITNDHYY